MRRFPFWVETTIAVLALIVVAALVTRPGTRSSPKVQPGVASPGAAAARGTSAPSPSPTPPAGCSHLSVWLCQDFDSTAAGAIPKGWFSAGPVTVAAGQAHSGNHSLEAGVIALGPRVITTSLTGLGLRTGEQWGRIFFKVKMPAPYSATQILHSTIVSERAISPLHFDPIETRPVGIEGSHDGKPGFQYLYNVQPLSKRKEFASLSPFNWSYDSSWHCAEWHMSFAQQAYQFFVDGHEVTSISLDNGPGKAAGVEIPNAFQSISIGWTNYRSAAVNGFKGFQAWVDDFALNGSRIGCA